MAIIIFIVLLFLISSTKYVYIIETLFLNYVVTENLVPALTSA